MTNQESTQSISQSMLSANLFGVTHSLFEDAGIYLRAIDAATYAKPIDLLFGSTIGQHTRHYIEFYQCMIAQGSAGDTINYDRRLRNKAIQRQPEAALQAMEAICEALLQGQETSTLAFEADFSQDGSACLRLESNFHREWIYNIEHTIHHLAIIKIGLKLEIPDLILPENFGVAPSTIRYKQPGKIETKNRS